MHITALLGRGTTAVLLSLLTAGVVAAPAQATERTEAGPQDVAVAGPTGPTLRIERLHEQEAPTPATKVTMVPPNRPNEMFLELLLAGDSIVYSNLAVTVSWPGSVGRCDPNTLLAERPENRSMVCRVQVPAMKPGETKKFWATFTGRQDGKLFSLTQRTTFYAADIRVGVYVDGKKATGGRFAGPRTGTSRVRLIFHNKTGTDMENVTDSAWNPQWCSIPLVRSGEIRTCEVPVDRSRIGRGGVLVPDMTVWMAHSVGTVGTTPRTTIVTG